jgi:hypothetical protein
MQLTPFKHENKNYAENLRSTESFRLRIQYKEVFIVNPLDTKLHFDRRACR